MNDIVFVKSYLPSVVNKV